MISSEHAVKRIRQISEHCLRMNEEHVQEAEAEKQEAEAAGFDIEAAPVVITSTDNNSVYWNYHRYIEFYSQFL